MPTETRRDTHVPIVELTLARLREFVREPEALFWTFLFPIIMSVAIAIAFPAIAWEYVRICLSPGAEQSQL